MIYKNAASQKLAVYAYTLATGAAKTGDAGNITCYLSQDWGAAAAVTDTNPTELDSTNMKGWYVFDLTQAETNAEVLVFAPVSATSGVVLDQVQVFTEASTPQTGDAYARLGAPAGTSVSADIAAIEAQTDDIGVAGAGLTALGDARLANLDAAVSTRSTLDAPGVRTAVGLAAANLDTQLADVPTVAEMNARTLASADYLVEGDTLARVTLVDTTTSNSDMRGTDNAALATTVAALNNLSSAQAQAAATAALNAYDPPTKAELDAADDAVLDAIAALNNIDAVAAQAAAAAALAAYNAAKVGDAMGAVASVTGNVGGNVVGSVGSVTNPVTAGTVSDKAGYALAATGLDAIPITAPAGVASTFREIVVQGWRRMFKKATMTATQMVTYADDGTTPLTTQAVSDDGETQTQGAAS